MNRRNKLNIKNTETILNTMHSDSIILNPKITADIEKEAATTLFSDIDDTNNMIDYSENKGNRLSKIWPLAGRCIYIVRYYLFLLLIFIIMLHFLNRPSEYALLMDEIRSLKKKSKILKKTHRLRNLASISNGISVATISPVYSYGFFRRTRVDPNCILEPGTSCLSLEGTKGEFKVKFPKEWKIVSIGLCHPPTANSKSGIHQFTATIGQTSKYFTFNGTGYEKFELAGEGEELRIKVMSNHGELRYTSIYRIYIYR